MNNVPGSNHAAFQSVRALIVSRLKRLIVLGKMMRNIIFFNILEQKMIIGIIFFYHRAVFLFPCFCKATKIDIK